MYHKSCSGSIPVSITGDQSNDRKYLWLTLSEIYLIWNTRSDTDKLFLIQISFLWLQSVLTFDWQEEYIKQNSLLRHYCQVHLTINILIINFFKVCRYRTCTGVQVQVQVQHLYFRANCWILVGKLVSWNRVQLHRLHSMGGTWQPSAEASGGPRLAYVLIGCSLIVIALCLLNSLSHFNQI